MKYSIPHVVQKFSSIFWEAGYELYLVGGAVRNLVLGRRPSDFDFATSARPEEVKSLFKRVIPTGIAHGTVTVNFMKHSFEVTTYRVDGEYTDNRRPDSVTFSRNLTEDLERRDFTMNAMAVHPITGEVYDPFDGRADLARRLIRTVGRPEKRFSEDALRLMRALRFSAQLGFEIEEAALAQLSALAPTVSHVSVERFRDEFLKILEAASPGAAIRRGVSTRVFQTWLPELDLFGYSRDGFNLLDHSIATLEALPDGAAVGLRLAAFFHDIGKALCEGFMGDGARSETGEPAADGGGVAEDAATSQPDYRNHEGLGADLVFKLLERLKLPNKLRDETVHLVRHHMFDQRIHDKPAAVRRFINRVGRDSVYDLLILRQADIQGKNRAATAAFENIRHLEAAVARELATGKTTIRREDLAIDGNALMDIGIPRGRSIGIVLEELLEACLDDPELNTRERLAQIAKNIYETKFKVLEEPRA